MANYHIFDTSNYEERHTDLYLSTHIIISYVVFVQYLYSENTIGFLRNTPSAYLYDLNALGMIKW